MSTWWETECICASGAFPCLFPECSFYILAFRNFIPRKESDKFVSRKGYMKRALLQIHLAVLLWGLTGVLGRAILLDAFLIVWYRMLLTAGIIALLLAYRRQWVSIPRKDFLQMTLIGILMGSHWVAFYASIKLANVSIALVCLSSASVFTTLLHAWIYRSRPDPGELFIGTLALAGVLMMYFLPQLSLSGTAGGGDIPMKDKNLGIFLGIFAAALSSLFTILNKKLAGKYPVRLTVFYEMATGWLVLSLLLPLYFFYIPGMPAMPRIQDMLLLFILALCCTVWAQSLALSALKYISSFTATLSVNLEPLYGVLLAFLLFGENKELGWDFYAGMLLICLSVVLQMMRLLRSRNNRSDGTTEDISGSGL